MCCGGCGMAEKIREEHGVAEINRKAAVWKASLSFSWLDPYWYLRSNFRAQIGNEKKKKKKPGPILNMCDLSFLARKKDVSQTECLDPQFSPDHLSDNETERQDS